MSSLIGSSEPRGELRSPDPFGQLVPAAASATEARGHPPADHENAPESGGEAVTPHGPKPTPTAPTTHPCNNYNLYFCYIVDMFGMCC